MQAMDSIHLPKYQYTTVNDMYHSPLVINPVKDMKVIFNFYGKFVDHKPGVLILEDFTLDCVCHLIIHEETEKFFDKNFYPWFLFRIHRAECTSASTNYNKGPKKLYFNLKAKEAINWIVSISMITKDGLIFKNHKSKSPTFEAQDDSIIEGLRNTWITRMNKYSIADLKGLKEKKIPKVSFIAQIIGYKKINDNKMILKVWDGSKRDFDLRLPVRNHNDPDTFDVSANRLDKNLNNAARDRCCYVGLLGERLVNQLHSKPAGSFIMFINAKIYDYVEISPPAFRIELVSYDKEDKAYCKVFDEQTPLGEKLITKIRPHLNNVSSTHTNNNQLQPNITHSSFDLDISRNQIYTINYFNDIKSYVNYKVFCMIVDLFPLNWDVFDLIILKCAKCNLQDTVKNIFEADLDNLRQSLYAFFTIYGDRGLMNCPVCFQQEAYLEFFIILLLEDKNLDRCVAVLYDNETRKLFKQSALETLSSKDKEYRFVNQLKELMNIFKETDPEIHRNSMVIKNDSNIYKIKDILHHRKLIF